MDISTEHTSNKHLIEQKKIDLFRLIHQAYNRVHFAVYSFLLKSSIFCLGLSFTYGSIDLIQNTNKCSPQNTLNFFFILRIGEKYPCQFVVAFIDWCGWVSMNWLLITQNWLYPNKMRVRFAKIKDIQKLTNWPIW